MKSHSQKPTRKSSFIYFQIGLILALLLAIVLIENKTENTPTEIGVLEPRSTITEKPYLNPRIIKEKEVEPRKKKKVVKRQTPQRKMTEKLKITDKELIVEFLGKVTDSEKSKDPDKLNLQKPEADPGKDPIEPMNYLRVEEMPVFPGCGKYDSKNERKACFSSKIAQLLQERFNGRLAEELGLSGMQKIYVSFTIDEKGMVTNIKARAAYDELSKEAIQVTKMLPKMKPARQGGRNVPMMYSLPIIFEVK